VGIDEQSCTIDRTGDEQITTDMTVNARHFIAVSCLAGCQRENTSTGFKVKQLHRAVGVANTRSLT